MARWIRGAANAWQNQMNWQAKHERQADIDSTSLFGMGTWIPNIRHTWNHLMFIPAVAKGFLLGEEVQEIDALKFAEGSKNTPWSEDQQKHLEQTFQNNEQRIRAIENQVMGVLTLNLNRFNEGRQAWESMVYGETVNDARTLLPVNKDGVTTNEKAIKEIESPNLPREVAQTAQAR